MGVGLQENTGANRNDGWFMGLVNRPEQTALAQGAPTPVSLRAVSVLPTSVIQNRQADELTKLQFWTFKPIVWAVNSSSQ